MCAKRGGGPFEIFQHFCRKTSTKLKGHPLKSLEYFRKSLTMLKKNEKGTLWEFSTFLSQNIKKIEGDTFGGKIFLEKSPTMP